MERISSRINRVRDNRGAAIMSLCLLLCLFMIFIIFFAFDMSRVQMAARELTAVCDAASIAGSAMITAKDTSFEDANLDTLNTTQLAAMQYAKNMVGMANVLGYQCYDPAMGTAPTGGASPVKLNFVNSQGALANPTPGTMNVFVQLVSPISGYVPAAPGTSSARGVQVQLCYGYKPFLSVLGINSVSVPACSYSSLQKLFVVMVFDCSGSMDDNTEVSFVYRRWTDSTDGALNAANGGKGQYVYNVVASGQLWQSTGFDYAQEPNGTNVNVLYPQNLDYLGFIYANQPTSYGNSQTYFDLANPPLAFDEAIADYVPWPAGSAAVKGCYNANYQTYPSNIVGPAPSFPGHPCFDNYFGTPPGNCAVKYGPAPAGASYGGQQGSDITNPLKSLNVVSYANPSQLPGPDSSPGYYYYPTGYNASNPPNYGSDGNLYFYDPYSMPMRNTNASYTAFTDMVANITSVIPPVTQPFYGPSSFSGFTETFPSGSSTYTIAIAETTAANLTQTGQYEYNSTLQSNAYKFTNIAYVVEASRGNLDNEWNSSGSSVNSTPTNYDNALLGYGSNLGLIARTTCKAGYQQAYERLAMYVSQPYATAVDGARRFFQNLCQTSCCNFGFVGFSVAPATTALYNCAYFSKTLGTGNSGTTSLGLAAPANTYKPNSVYSSYVYQPLAGCNPCFWVSNTLSTNYAAGPSGSPSGEAYDLTLNTTGPSRSTWLSINSVQPPSNSTTLWANNYPGFQIPRLPLNATNTQGAAYYGVAGDDWADMNPGNDGSGNNGTVDYGCNGVQRARPLYDTDGLEALQYALYNLTNISSLTSLTTSQGGTSKLTLPSEYGSKKAICFFTDGVPTDDGTPYSLYKSEVATPAQKQGVAIYSIGLSLNNNIKADQSNFLQALANYGACGSQEFQVTSSASLDAAFCGIARQLAQGQH